MERLLDEDIRIEPVQGGTHILASYYSNQGYRHWEKYALADLPNDLISGDDLERFGIDVIHHEAGVSE